MKGFSDDTKIESPVIQFMDVPGLSFLFIYDSRLRSFDPSLSLISSGVLFTVCLQCGRVVTTHTLRTNRLD